MTGEDEAAGRDDGWVVIGVFAGGSGAVRPAVEAWLRARGAAGTVLGDDDVIVHPLCGRDGAGRWVHEMRVLIRRDAVRAEG